MSTPEFHDPRLTEQRNPRTQAIDSASSLEIVDLMHAEDRLVPDAVHACRQDIARVVDLVVDAFRAGGYTADQSSRYVRKIQEKISNARVVVSG